jgi:ribosomal peptide maturation radical SAM protein 1
LKGYDVKTEASRVLLVQMPWANLSLPSLATGLLKSILERDGLSCDALYGNLLGVDLLGGFKTYDRLAVELASELIFSPICFQTDRTKVAQQLVAEFGQSTVNPTESAKYYLDLIDRAEEFIERLFENVRWELYDIVGFSITFQQTLPSLCLAQKIKQHFPDKLVVFGGASCDGDMGPELLRSFRQVDYVVVGEADGVIVDVVRALRERRAAETWNPTVPGLVYRNDRDEVQYTGAIPPTEQLDQLPDPDYTEYFATLEALGEAGPRPRLYLEQSRGCWYGEKMACRFCGLSSMKFRRKSPERAVSEMLALSAKYQVSDFYMSDNILDYKYFDTVLPELARLRHAQGYDFTVFYEVKANLKRWQVEVMAAAGIVMVQIGIESFDDHILHLMAKGVAAIQQIQSLKHLHNYGISAVWNILYANPLELPEDYLSMAAVIPSLHHLPPPHRGQVGPMILQRFSRYWQNPRGYGIENIRPLPIYQDIFPQESVNLDRLACFFEYDHADQENQALAGARQMLFDAIEDWRQLYREGSLTYVSGPGWVKIRDKRLTPIRHEPGDTSLTLRGLQAEIFEFCDSAQSEKKVCERFEGRAASAQLVAFLDLLVEKRLMHRSPDRKYLSLPLHLRNGKS